MFDLKVENLEHTSTAILTLRLTAHAPVHCVQYAAYLADQQPHMYSNTHTCVPLMYVCVLCKSPTANVTRYYYNISIPYYMACSSDTLQLTFTICKYRVHVLYYLPAIKLAPVMLARLCVGGFLTTKQAGFAIRVIVV